MFIKIFINIEANNMLLIAQTIKENLSVQLDNDFYYKNKIMTIELRKNEDNDRNKAKEFPDGFLYFSHYLEIESFEKQDEIILELSNLLEDFWKNNIPAIAACDIEDSLPNNGGYNSKKVPWVHS